MESKWTIKKHQNTGKAHKLEVQEIAEDTDVLVSYQPLSNKLPLKLSGSTQIE